MTDPVRIQLRRTKGWRMPPNTVKVDRTTKFGNPFLVDAVERTRDECVSAFRLWLTNEHCDAGLPERKAALLKALPELRGRNLACWCKRGSPCHADVLLEIANQEPEAWQ